MAQDKCTMERDVHQIKMTSKLSQKEKEASHTSKAKKKKDEEKKKQKKKRTSVESSQSSRVKSSAEAETQEAKKESCQRLGTLQSDRGTAKHPGKQ